MDEKNRLNISKEERELIVDVIKNSRDHIGECEMYDVLFNTKNCDNLTCRECRINVNKRLAALIESATAQSDGIPYPLDKDGVPIRIGDTIYSNSGNKYEVINITIGKNQNVAACQNGCFPAHFRYPESELSHNAPRTLEDIKEEAYAAHKELVSEEFKGTINVLFEEAYELGRKAAENGN